MSAHLTANPEGATHGLVDDRESALHVLLYMSIRHLAHNKANSYEMLDLLNMFDGYIEIEGSPYRKGTMSKRHFIISGGKELDFEIQVMNELIQHLCEQFSARYTSSTAKRSIVPLIAKSDAEHEAQALDLKSKLYNISEDSQWLYHLLRTFAAYLPIRSPVEIDYIDNTKLLLQVCPDFRGHEPLMTREDGMTEEILIDFHTVTVQELYRLECCAPIHGHDTSLPRRWLGKHRRLDMKVLGGLKGRNF